MGVVALAQTVADIVIDFRTVTGTDIGIIVPVATDSDLPRWGARVAALTSSQTLTPFLKYVSTLHPDPAALDEDRLHSWQGVSYGLHRIPLSELMEAQPGFIVLVSDVNSAVANIDRATRNGLLLAGCTVAAAELILLLLVRTPIRRLRRLAQTLPLLAHGAHNQARGRLAANRPAFGLTDEIDIVDQPGSWV